MGRAAVYAVAVVVGISLVICQGCTGGASYGIPVPDSSALPAEPVVEWPTGLPLDAVQPWEQVNAAGYIVPVTNGRLASAANSTSEFVAGVERYDDGGSAADYGEAVALTSAAGSVSYAIYRAPLGGAEPGVVSVDANLTADGGYYAGLADYGTGAWEWHGPFADSHVRLSCADTTGASDYTNSLGNVFVCVVVYDGAAVDVVGIGVNVTDGGDETPPPTPAAPSITPVSGGLLLEWLPVIAADHAGYRIYYSAWHFFEMKEWVNVEDSLEGLTSHLPVTLATSAASGFLNDAVTLTATGAETYDFDTDGDGTYEITGDLTGTAGIDTTSLGIIRPAVRGSFNSGESLAFAGVSVVIAGNSRPVAIGYADPSFGDAPLQVNFTGLANDFDGTIVQIAWDFDGDQTYDWTSTVIEDPPPFVFTAPGIYNAKYRV